MKHQDRRAFLKTTAAGFLPLTAMTARAESKPLFRISLAQWTLVKEIRSGKIDNLDFARVAAEHKIEGLEYVNQFFMDKAKDASYLAEMKKRAADSGVKSLIIMCDREGNIGDPDPEKRARTVDNHRKWLDAAKTLGCHSIRVNAGSSGTWEEQVKLASDGLASLTEIGAGMDLNVIVENHGGLSSNGKWLAGVISKVNHDRCGTLPDFGNFKISGKESYDSYRGIEELMPFARGVSVKDRVWDDDLKSSPLDFEKMLRIVLKSGFRGFCGIEYGGYEGLNASRERLEKARETLAGEFDSA
jgi:sugar phosphate isomerase/epimerase